MKSIIGLILGFTIGLGATALAQQVYLVDPNNVVCWTQNQGTLIEVNAWRVRVTYNTLAPQDVQHSCSGNPIECKLLTPVPAALQVTPLNVKVEAAAVNPDGTLTSYNTLLTGSLSFGTAAPAPPPNSGSNLRIIKLVASIVKAILSWMHLG